MRALWPVLFLGCWIAAIGHAQSVAGPSVGIWTPQKATTFRAVVSDIQSVCVARQKRSLAYLKAQCAKPTTPAVTPLACTVISEIIENCACDQNAPGCLKVCFSACDFSSCSNALIQSYCVDNCIPDMVTLCNASNG